MTPFEARIDAELRAGLEASGAGAGAPPATDIRPGSLRAAYRDGRAFWNHPLPAMKSVEQLAVEGPVGAVRIQLLHPPVPGPAPVIVYLHGGGWVVGDLETHARIMRVLAERSGAVVVGIDYARAPEHRFPVPIDETCAVLRWLRANGAAHGIDPERLALAGDSAGANIAAACMVQQARDGLPAARAMGLLYGAFGLADSASMREFGHAESGLSAANMTFFYRCYLRGPDDAHDPRVDVLRAPAEVFAPSIVVAAELDPLLDDSRAFAAHLCSAGVEVELHVAKGMLHGFAHMTRSVTEARRQLYAVADFLAARLLT